MNQIAFCLVPDRKENYQHDHIAINLEGFQIFLSEYAEKYFLNLVKSDHIWALSQLATCAQVHDPPPSLKSVQIFFSSKNMRNVLIRLQEHFSDAFEFFSVKKFSF